MVSKAHLFTFILFSAVVVICGDEIAPEKVDIQPTLPTKKTTTAAPTTTPNPAPTTSTVAPTTTPTPAPTTTAAPTTPPTPPPTSSSTTTPTPAPTTPTPAPTTPTPAPTTPTPAPTTPAPAPTTPAPPAKDWVVYGPNGTICIVANMGIKINVKYITKTNATNCTKIEINKVSDAVASGTCFADNQTLVLTRHDSVVAEFMFQRNTTANKTDYSLAHIKLTIPASSLYNISSNDTKVVLSHDVNVFTLPLNKSYSCAVVDTLPLNGTTGNKTLEGTISLSSVHAEAFGIKNKTSYSEAVDCKSSGTPDIVPIVVGLVLAGLVIVVLIAYLVGRRRAQARGYLSM